ncbi:MAG: DUF1565 domain-containing protein [bacterium]
MNRYLSIALALAIAGLVIGGCGDDETTEPVCDLTVTGLYVNASTGNDLTGTGCPRRPLKTITRALELAEPGYTVHVAPGTYDSVLGEVFPLTIEDSITVVGDNWETCVISGRGDNASSDYNEAVTMSGESSALRRFTLEQGGGEGEPWHLAIYVMYWATGALVDSIRIFDRGDFSVLRIQGARDCVVSSCRFTPTGAVVGRGFEVCSNDSGTVIRNCTVTGFSAALFFNYKSNAAVEGCVLEGNGLAAELCCTQYEDSEPNPDFGGGSRGSAGGNIIRNNEECGLYNDTPNEVFAKYNTWENDPPVEGTDFCNVGGGSVTWH